MFTEKDLSLYTKDSAFHKTVSEIILPFLTDISVKDNPLVEIDKALESSESALYGINNKTGLDTYKQRVRSSIFQACCALLEYRKSLPANAEEFHQLDKLLVQVNKFLKESGVTELKGNFYALYIEAADWLPQDMDGSPVKATHALMSVYFMLKVLEIKMGGLAWLLPRDIPEKINYLQNKLKSKYKKITQQQEEIAAKAELQKEREAGFEAQFAGALSRALVKLDKRCKQWQSFAETEERKCDEFQCLEAVLRQNSGNVMRAFWTKYNSHEKFSGLLKALSLSAFQQGRWFKYFYARHGKGISWAWHFLEKKCLSTQLNREKLTKALCRAKNRSLLEIARQNVEDLQQARVKLAEVCLWIKNLPKVPTIAIATLTQDVLPTDASQSITSRVVSGFVRSRAEMIAAINQLESQESALKLWFVELDKLKEILSLKAFRKLDMSEFSELYTALLKEMHSQVLQVGVSESNNEQATLAELNAYHQPLIESLKIKVLELDKQAKSLNELSYNQAIQSLGAYLNLNTGIIEQVARFFSPSYRQCVEVIEEAIEKYHQGQFESSRDCFQRINDKLKTASGDAWSWSLGGQKIQSLVAISSRVRLFPLAQDMPAEQIESVVEIDEPPASGWFPKLSWMN